MSVVNFKSVTLISPDGVSVRQPSDTVIEDEVRKQFEASRGDDSVLLLECVWRDVAGKSILSLDGSGNGLVVEGSKVKSQQQFRYSNPKEAATAWLDFLRAHRTI